MSSVRLVLLAVGVVALAACAQPVPVPKPVDIGADENRVYKVVNPGGVESWRVDIGAAEYPRVYSAAMAELRDEGFILDREEYRFGLLTTRPLPSPTMFEPWKELNSTDYQAYRATLTDQRRIVSVHIDPVARPPKTATRPAGAPAAATGPARGFRLSVDVRIEQAQLPNRRLSGSTSGPSIINTLTATPDELRERGIKGPYWQLAGHDPYLAERILAGVMRRAAQPDDNPPAPTTESIDTGTPSAVTP